MPDPHEPRMIALGPTEQSPVTEVRIALLLDSDSPRHDGESIDHVRALAQLDTPLPPIIVNRTNMRVIDGMHRLRATRMLGRHTIAVRFFDGDEVSAFILAVKANITHGLPLSLADRKAAASRILASSPQWSDRMIAEVTALSARTIATLRKSPTEEKQHLDARVGRDGRVRPVDRTERRARAAQFMAENPRASLREVARRCGLSPETVRDVKSRQGANGVKLRPATADTVLGAPAVNRSAAPRADRTPRSSQAAEVMGHSLELRQILKGLTSDPSVRSSELGRTLLRALGASIRLTECGEELANALPGHCADRVVLAARLSADGWQNFASQFKDHPSRSDIDPGRRSR